MAEKSGLTVVKNEEKRRFETAVGDQVAYTEFQESGPIIVLSHTEVPSELGGQGIGSLLARAALDDARSNGLKVIPVCPFVTGYLRKHPEYQDLVWGQSSS